VNGKRRRPGFLPLHREGIAEIRGRLGRQLAAMAVFIQLVAEADIQTGEVLMSIRTLASHLELRRDTLSRYLDLLTKAGLIEVYKADNGFEQTLILIPEYEWLTGAFDAPPLNGGPQTGPAVSDAADRGPVGGPQTVPPMGESGPVGGPVGGPVSGPLTVPLHPDLPAASVPRPSRPSRPSRRDPQDARTAAISPEGSPPSGQEPATKQQPRTEEEPALDGWGRIWRSLVDSGCSEEDAFLLLARRWVKTPTEDRETLTPVTVLRDFRSERARAS